jgi:hypothetical protein
MSCTLKIKPGSEACRLISAEYEKELKRYIARVKDLPGLSGVMTMGSVKAPGLSDLDIVCVVNSMWKKENSAKLNIDLKGYKSGVFIHGPLIISEELLPDLQYIIWANNLTDIYGELSRLVKAIPENEQPYLSLSYLVDFSESRFLQFEDCIKDKVLDRRSWYARFWSLTHSLSICRNLGLDLSDEGLATIKAVKELRYGWLGGRYKSDDDFVKLFWLSYKLYKEIFVKAIGKVNSYFLPYVAGGDKVKFSGPGKKIFCTKVQKNIQVFYCCLKMGKYRVWSKLCLKGPFAYALHLWGYGFGDIPSEIQKHPYISLLSKRCDIVRKHEQFLDDNGMSFSLRGYLGFPRTKSLFSMISRKLILRISAPH